MTINRRKFLAAGATAALAAPFYARLGLADDPIKFVSILDQTGGLDIYGRPMVETTKMAIDEMNAAGGLLGRQIDL